MKMIMNGKTLKSIGKTKEEIFKETGVEILIDNNLKDGKVIKNSVKQEFFKMNIKLNRKSRRK